MSDCEVDDLGYNVQKRITNRGLEIIKELQNLEMKGIYMFFHPIIVGESGAIEWTITQKQFIDNYINDNGDKIPEHERLDEWLVEFKQRNCDGTDKCDTLTASFYAMHDPTKGWCYNRLKIQIATDHFLGKKLFSSENI